MRSVPGRRSQYYESGTFTRGEELRRLDSRILRIGLFAQRAGFPGRRKRDLGCLRDRRTQQPATAAAGTHIDLIGSRERVYINKIYLGKNTGILYRVEIEAGTPYR